MIGQEPAQLRLDGRQLGVDRQLERVRAGLQLDDPIPKDRGAFIDDQRERRRLTPVQRDMRGVS